MLKKPMAALFTGASALGIAMSANAQGEDETSPLAVPVEVQKSDMQTLSAPETQATAEDTETSTELNPDEMADQLNSQQQLKQSFTLKRTINGQEVETEKRTVVYSRNQPYRETEAGESTKEKLIKAFDGELLTRTEAYEEAKLDFSVADRDLDGQMTAEEFAILVDSWQRTDANASQSPVDKSDARQRQYDAFLAEISPETASVETKTGAMQKFSFMAGESATISRDAYIREYLLDFDSMDANKDMILRDEELIRFRALNRGETLNM